MEQRRQIREAQIDVPPNYCPLLLTFQFLRQIVERRILDVQHKTVAAQIYTVL